MFKSTIFILSICTIASQAGVIRPSDKDSNMLEISTIATEGFTTTLEPESSTVTNSDSAITTTEKLGALSRDEEATILIVDQVLLDPAPADLIKAKAGNIEITKSAKLLLLSTPKIAEKPKEPEENLEESEEENETVENGTQINIETTTVESTNEDFTKTLNAEVEATTEVQMTEDDEIKSEDISKPESGATSEEKQSGEASIEDTATAKRITKLYPINDTLYADNKKMMDDETKETSETLVEDQPEKAFSSNLCAVVIEESEADFVLVEPEVLEGSYTNVDSELHLQPIVQSIEIVPASLDDTLLINYVQRW